MKRRSIRLWLGLQILSLGEALSGPGNRGRRVCLLTAMAALLVAVIAWNASANVAIGTQPSIQRATTW
ncbi:hypothetical protein [Pseudaminobacter sp. NGMCC 1.201702]|uniref:hypothetical protein n=1 Tax=Pseudaminobacter sp. NGMCC 1.201702 TaxID=3391825 RepID=UPI0039EFA0C5